MSSQYFPLYFPSELTSHFSTTSLPLILLPSPSPSSSMTSTTPTISSLSQLLPLVPSLSLLTINDNEPSSPTIPPTRPSTPILGSPPPTRPPQLRRSKRVIHLEECKHCHYHSDDVDHTGCCSDCVFDDLHGLDLKRPKHVRTSSEPIIHSFDNTMKELELASKVLPLYVNSVVSPTDFRPSRIKRYGTYYSHLLPTIPLVGIELNPGPIYSKSIVYCEAVMGDDTTVVNAARVSFNKHVESISDSDSKLLNYLAVHEHWSPFAHPQIRIRIKMPIFVCRQWFKHTIGFTRNEVSRRYVKSEPEFYDPIQWRKAASNIKQGSSDEVFLTDRFNKLYELQCQTGLGIYNTMIKEGVCPEQARMILPQSTMSEVVETGSLYGYARLCKLRLESHAQKEIREVAEQVFKLMNQFFPISWRALMNSDTPPAAPLVGVETNPGPPYTSAIIRMFEYITTVKPTPPPRLVGVETNPGPQFVNHRIDVIRARLRAKLNKIPNAPRVPGLIYPLTLGNFNHVMNELVFMWSGWSAYLHQKQKLVGIETNPGPWTEDEYVEVYGFPEYQISINGIVYDTVKQRVRPIWINNCGYKCVWLRNNSKITAYIHVLLAQSFGILEDEDMDVDHLDGNRINNDLSNLYPKTRQENNFNTKKHISINGKPTYSLYIGVTFERNRWRARARFNRKKISLGSYDTEREAAEAYNEFVNETRGVYACINDLDSPGKVIRPILTSRNNTCDIHTT